MKSFWQLWNERRWTGNPSSINLLPDVSTFKQNCAVKYVDSFGIEPAAKVEAESLFQVPSVVEHSVKVRAESAYKAALK